MGKDVVLTSVDGEQIKPFVVAWLGLRGLVILYRAWKGARPKPFSWKAPAPRYTRGVLRKFAKGASSASKGAVLDLFE